MSVRNARPAILAALLIAAAGGCGSPQPFVVIAHRGASAHAPEHTFAAYDLALEMGADFIEQDLQMTSDGVLVVLHDDTLERTVRGPVADCTGSVRDKTYAQLQRCEVSSWWVEEGGDRPGGPPERIPLLADVLHRYGDTTRYYIETKQPDEAPGMEEALLRTLAEYDLLPGSPADRRVLVQSFSARSLDKLSALNPDVPLIQLIGRDDMPIYMETGLQGVAGYAVGIGPSWRAVTPAVVAEAHRYGLLVHPYTVDEVAEMDNLIDLGVDGLFTNFPDRLIAARARAGR